MSGENRSISFAKILAEKIEKQQFVLISDTTDSLLEEKARDIAKEIVYRFETYGDFLDPVPYDDKNTLIENALLPWIKAYCINVAIDKLKNTFQLNGEALKEIKKDIRTIEKFEAMLLKRFSLLGDESPSGDEFLDITISLEHDSSKVNILKNIQLLLKDIKALKRDLVDKEFKLFSKYKYYYPRYTTKQTLTNILDQIIQEYDLSSHSPHKKQLVDSINPT